MSRSDASSNRSNRQITGLEILCVLLMPMLWGSLVRAILHSVNFFPWFYGREALDSGMQMQMRQMLWINALSAPFQVASALAFLCSGVGISLGDIGITTRNLRRNILRGLVFGFIFIPGSLAIQALALMTLEAVGSKPTEHPFTQLGSMGLLPIEWGLLVFGAVVVAPWWEELVYRGLIQPWILHNGSRGSLVAFGLAGLLAAYAVALEWVASPSVGEAAVKLAPLWILALLVGVFFFLDRRNVVWGGLFAAAVLFAWVHVSVWPSPVPLVWLALGLGWLAWRGQSLVGAIVLHTLFNGVACIALFLGPTEMNLEKPPVAPTQIPAPGDLP